MSDDDQSQDPQEAAVPTPETKASRKPIPLGSIFDSYQESYAEAWRQLMPRCRAMAMPILYLQRHSFELLVKDLLRSAIYERSTLHDLDEMFGTALGPGPANPSDFALAHTTHMFRELFPRLIANRDALRRTPLPPEFIHLHDLFVEVDDDRPDRLRYETLFNRNKGTTNRSFPRDFDEGPRKYAPCEEVAEVLEKILACKAGALDAIVQGKPAPESVLGRFFYEEYEASDDVDAEVWSRLRPILKATEDGAIRWTAAHQVVLQIDDHPELKDMRDAAKACVEARFQERLFTLIVFRDTTRISGGGRVRHENGFFLAVRRPNATLTPGIWLEGYQTEMAHRVLEAYKRYNQQGQEET